jgi:hypothetical protein
MLLMFLFSAIAIAMVVVVRIEISVATRFVQAAQALYAADAALAVTLSELRTLADWTPVLSGTTPPAALSSSVVDRIQCPDGSIGSPRWRGPLPGEACSGVPTCGPPSRPWCPGDRQPVCTSSFSSKTMRTIRMGTGPPTATGGWS